jgi:hypothetical protein
VPAQEWPGGKVGAQTPPAHQFPLLQSESATQLPSQALGPQT